jgi:xylulokinase
MQLGASHVSDSNLAAMSGFYSIPGKCWWARAIEAAGISADQLGLVVETGKPVPTRSESRRPGYSESLEIVFAGNDHTAGAVGCGCRKGLSVMTLGTAGVYYRWAGSEPGPFSSHGLWGPYPGGGYYELFHISHACSALDWADKYLFGSVDSQRFVESARKAGPDTPFFDPDRWGSAGAWSFRTNVEEMACAVLEGIAFALRACAGEAPGAKDDGILILGGGSRLDFWVQLLANTFQCPFTRSGRDGLDGAAILAGPDIPADHSQPPNRRFAPEASRMDELEKHYSLWRSHQLEPAKWNA